MNRSLLVNKRALCLSPLNSTRVSTILNGPCYVCLPKFMGMSELALGMSENVWELRRDDIAVTSVDAT